MSLANVRAIIALSAMATLILIIAIGLFLVVFDVASPEDTEILGTIGTNSGLAAFAFVLLRVIQTSLLTESRSSINKEKENQKD